MEMNMKIVETSLNLRIQRGHKCTDYVLIKEIADEQLKLEADIYANVEYMECEREAYLETFRKAGYKGYSTVDDKYHRGILCEVKNEYDVKEIASKKIPHILHLRISKNKKHIDLIIMRILVDKSDDEDFKDRQRQWEIILEYIDTLDGKENIVLTGDFNHGVIQNKYEKYHARRFFNYQMIVSDLNRKDIELFPIDGYSYRDYMKIDHIATGKNIRVVDGIYKEVFKPPFSIGIPDHKLIISNLKCL